MPIFAVIGKEKAEGRKEQNCIGDLSCLLWRDEVGLPDSWYIYCLDILSCLLPSSHIKHEDSHYGVLKWNIWSKRAAIVQFMCRVVRS